MSIQPGPRLEPAASSSESDERLVARVLGGERELFTVIMRRHNQRIYRAARAIMRDDAEAEDVAQQSWVTGFHKLADFRGEASFSAWITRIAVNEALGRLRTRTRRGDVALVDEGAHLAMAKVDRTPEDETSARELTRMIERQVDDLPEIYRAIFVLRDVEEMSTAEAAHCLGITEETARIRLFRARHLLQAAIADAIGPAAVRAFGFAGERCDRIVGAVLGRIEIEP